jgi:hypothetical protein
MHQPLESHADIPQAERTLSAVAELAMPGISHAVM